MFTMGVITPAILATVILAVQVFTTQASQFSANPDARFLLVPGFGLLPPGQSEGLVEKRDDLILLVPEDLKHAKNQ